MGSFLGGLVKWLIGHPEVIEAVASAVTKHQAKGTK